MKGPCNKNHLMHYLSSVYFVNHPLHVSGIFVAHHQEVKGKGVPSQARCGPEGSRRGLGSQTSMTFGT